jgi:hypothetical protein
MIRSSAERFTKEVLEFAEKRAKEMRLDFDQVDITIVCDVEEKFKAKFEPGFEVSRAVN